MKRLVVLFLLFVPAVTQAGSCGYHYGSYGHNSYYSYSPSYSNSYYWPGGYYGGGGGYSPGYYAPGYYEYYNNHYSQPYFIKYKAVIPLVELPTYGVYVQDSPPERVVTSTAPAVTSNLDSKLDKILTLTEKTSKDVDSLRVRVELLEGKRTAEPSRNVAPAADPDQEAVNILHTRCYACHEAKAVMTSRSKVTLFVKTDAGDEMATIKDGKPDMLPLNVIKKVKDVLTDKSMPPEKDKDGHAVAVMSDDERRKALAFITKVMDSQFKR
jgi:hypothetical protein